METNIDIDEFSESIGHHDASWNDAFWLKFSQQLSRMYMGGFWFCSLLAHYSHAQPPKGHDWEGGERSV